VLKGSYYPFPLHFKGYKPRKLFLIVKIGLVCGSVVFLIAVITFASDSSEVRGQPEQEFISEFQPNINTNSTAIKDLSARSDYDMLKLRYQQVINLCSPSLLDKFTSLLKTSPTREECDEIMIVLYATCQELIQAKFMIEGLSDTTLPDTPLGKFVREQCSNERLLNYDYPKGRSLDLNSLNSDLLQTFANKYILNSSSPSP
jgi:hypothetical protein